MVQFHFFGINPLTRYAPDASQMSSMWMNVTVFFALGLVLLRNRDRARRRLRELGEQGLSWLEAFWPAPYILIGVFATGFFPLLVAGSGQENPQPWHPQPQVLNMSLFLFRLTFFALWLCRDLLYLQWMNLRPGGRKPPVRAILYGAVYYIALFVMFFTRSGTVQPGEAAFQSIFVPVRVLVLDTASWNQASGAWLVALVSQGVLMFFFAFLHRQELRSLTRRPKIYPTAIPPAMRPGAPTLAG